LPILKKFLLLLWRLLPVRDIACRIGAIILINVSSHVKVEDDILLDEIANCNILLIW
jgi:hypothetical protein